MQPVYNLEGSIFHQSILKKIHIKVLFHLNSSSHVSTKVLTLQLAHSVSLSYLADTNLQLNIPSRHPAPAPLSPSSNSGSDRGGK